ncbi:MAG: TonB-dependent receptor [Saprospiraceae bacterium]|nr:TonB-dependent receptor [Saprospiraceae bacterium]
MLRHLLFILFFLSSFFSYSQSASIKGFIFGADSLSHLTSVHIYLEHTEYNTTSNPSGYYHLKNIPEGTYKMKIKQLGYQTISQDVKVEKNEDLNLNFVLTESITSLPEIMVITRGYAGIKDIPGSVQYLSKKELQKFHYTDINRSLNSIPGIHIQEEDGYGLRPNIGLRGTGVERSSKITIMEDGVLMAPAPYSEPAAYYFPTTGRMQAIEVIKGSSQVKYGPFTTGGALNLVSTQIPDQFAGELSLSAGSHGNKNLHAHAGNSHDHYSYLMETFHYSSDGFKQLDGGGKTGFDKKDYLIKFALHTHRDADLYQSLTFKLGQATETSNETYLGLSNEDFELNPYRRYYASKEDLMQTEQQQYSATHLLKPSDHFEIKTVVYFNNFKRNWYKLDKVKNASAAKIGIAEILDDPEKFQQEYAFLRSPGNLGHALIIKANNRSYFGKGIQTQASFQFQSSHVAHKLDIGIRYHQDEAERFQWEDEYILENGITKLSKSGTPGSESNRVAQTAALAGFISYKINYKKWTLTPGLRYENMHLKQDDYGKSDPNRTGQQLIFKENKVSVFIPGLGANYYVNKNLNVFMGIHKGFSPPGVQNETEAEESTNYEIGLRYKNKLINLESVVFLNDYSNLLGSDLAASGGGGTGDLFNAGEVITKGIEFSLAYDIRSNLPNSNFSIPVLLTYTLAQSTFESSFKSSFEDWGIVEKGDEFPYLAKHQIFLEIGLVYDKFSVSATGKFNDRMRTTPGQGNAEKYEFIKSHLVFDASLHYQLHRNLKLFSTATNFSNAVYVVASRPAGLRPGLSRTLNIGLSAQF